MEARDESERFEQGVLLRDLDISLALVALPLTVEIDSTI